MAVYRLFFSGSYRDHYHQNLFNKSLCYEPCRKVHKKPCKVAVRELAAAAITEIATEPAVDAEDAAASPVVVHVVAADDLTQTSAAAARPAQVTDCGLLAILPKQPGTTVPTDLWRASACGFCGLAGDTLLLTCSRCKSMCYCSAAHQKQHW